MLCKAINGAIEEEVVNVLGLIFMRFYIAQTFFVLTLQNEDENVKKVVQQNVYFGDNESEEANLF